MAARALVGAVFVRSFQSLGTISPSDRMNVTRQPLLSLQMYTKLSVQGAASLLGGLTILLAALPFVFHRWGAAMRERSIHAAK